MKGAEGEARAHPRRGVGTFDEVEEARVVGRLALRVGGAELADGSVVLILEQNLVQDGMRVAALLRDALGEIRFPEVSGHAVQHAELPAAALVEDHVHELGGERAEISEVVIRRSALLNHATALGLDRGAIPRHLHDGPIVNLALPVRAQRGLVNVGVVKVPHHAVRGVDADCGNDGWARSAHATKKRGLCLVVARKREGH